MNYKNIKLELFYWRKAFFQYRQGFAYLKSKYFLAPKILKFSGVFEKPINQNELSIHILSCHRDLVILVWSLASFYRVAEFFGQLFIHNDGSLTDKDKAVLKKFFPTALIIEPVKALAYVNKELAGYPLIKELRTNRPEFFLLKKLIDPYCVSEKPRRLIIDSDLLWFKNSELINQEINFGGPAKSYMIAGKSDTGQPNYIYFKNGDRLSGQLANFNSGVVLYAKENFDLEKLTEYLEKIDLDNPANRHFIEQAGYASCLKNLTGLPAENYQITDALGERTVVRHYTSPKRPLFFLEGAAALKSKIL